MWLKITAAMQNARSICTREICKKEQKGKHEPMLAAGGIWSLIQLLNVIGQIPPKALGAFAQDYHCGQLAQSNLQHALLKVSFVEFSQT